jgi:hypothetical protein
MENWAKPHYSKANSCYSTFKYQKNNIKNEVGTVFYQGLLVLL